MIEVLLAIIALGLIAVAVVGVLLIRRARDLTVSVECLCSNVGALREQIGHGH